MIDVWRRCKYYIFTNVHKNIIDYFITLVQMNSDKTTQILETINQAKANLQQPAYKPIFFKNALKFDNAKVVTQNMNFEELMDSSIYIIPGTNNIYMNYPIVKLFAYPEIFEHIAANILSKFTKCISENGRFSVHLNLKSFTISAAHRYKDLIQAFCNHCLHFETPFSDLLTTMYIYHTPGVMDSISKLFAPFIHPNVRDKIIFLDKNVSDSVLATIGIV